MKLNPNYSSLKSSYLFIDIAHRVAAYKEKNPAADIIRLGIGDVTLPLAQPVVKALQEASAEMGEAETFHGYGPEQGYPFLRQGIAGYYAARGITLAQEEIFVSDGAKSDIGNILELFSPDNTVLIPDPVYPAYVDANLMDGRKIIYAPATKQNGFLPLPDNSVKADIIYICSPNNPTGAAYTKAQLAQWVNCATKNEAVILFDAAYECFVSSPDVPRSIYEVEGAKECAVEICSLSKTAGFTGTRCGYTIVPNTLFANGQSLNKMWNRRQTTKYNETPYIVQRAAAAVFTPEGLAACHKNIEYYKNNAGVIGKVLDQASVWYSGGINSPYIWMECPNGMDSWQFFDLLLEKANIVGTPGAGFGNNGNGYFRLTGFGNAEKTVEAAARLKAFLSTL
ncbi:LL-diaminopimelate aminotransferase [Ruminococcaceae bacterium OttesenSCG-928-A16]|nr:LL-diaminopimelate aminotransferase [Ruminococcaceae bacterium OttesenSCG-928-A16]